MASGTRSSSHGANFDHVIRQLMGEALDSPLVLALKDGGYDYVEDILTMSKDDIDALEFPEKVDDMIVTKPLQRAKCALIRVFQDFIRHLRDENRFMTYMALTALDFNEYRAGIYVPDQPIPAPVHATTNKARNNLVDDFRRGIKRDKTHYTVLKEDKQWDSWKRSTLATARSHGCEDVF